MDDFWSGHDPASKPSDKNHIASPTDRQRACPRRCSTTKSSNSERIRFTTDFATPLREHASARSRRPSRVFFALAALLVAVCSLLAAPFAAHAARRGACACHLRREPREPGAEHTRRVAIRRRSPVKHARRRSSICSREMRHARAVVHGARVDVLAGRFASQQLSFGRSRRAVDRETNMTLLLRLPCCSSSRAADESVNREHPSVLAAPRTRARHRVEGCGVRGSGRSRGPRRSASGARERDGAPQRQNERRRQMRRSVAAVVARSTACSTEKSPAKKSSRRKSLAHASPAGWFCCQTRHV
jgi:hypothetical protein